MPTVEWLMPQTPEDPGCGATQAWERRKVEPRRNILLGSEQKQVGVHTPVIPALQRPRQEDHKCKASLGYRNKTKAIRHATTSASPCRLRPWRDPTRSHRALTPVITGLINSSSRLAFPKRSVSLHRKWPGILCYHILGIAFHLIGSFTPAICLTQETSPIPLYQEPLLTSHLTLAIFSYTIKMWLKLNF